MSYDQLEYLIRMQDILRCRLANTLAADDGFSEGNVHAGVYRALLELKVARTEIERLTAERDALRGLLREWFDSSDPSIGGSPGSLLCGKEQ